MDKVWKMHNIGNSLKEQCVIVLLFIGTKLKSRGKQSCSKALLLYKAIGKCFSNWGGIIA